MAAIRLLYACFFLLKLSDCALTRDNELAVKYSFSTSLDEDQNYWLYWKVDHDEGVASFAVQANAVGWIGFGISPDGNVPNSDVVTGWVANGKGYLQVRSVCDILCAAVQPLVRLCCANSRGALSIFSPEYAFQ